MPARLDAALPELQVTPLLRGVLHEAGFYVSVPLGAALVAAAEGGLPRAVAAVFAASVVAMFGASALYHRGTWSPAVRRRLRRLDHAGVYGLIAGLSVFALRTWAKSTCQSLLARPGSAVVALYQATSTTPSSPAEIVL